jgi:Zn-dependent protease with chaperone function
MSRFFYNLGRVVGPNLRKANWMLSSLTGTEKEALDAERAVGRDLAQAYIRQLEVDTNPAVQQLLNDVAGRLAACFTRKDYRFEVRAVGAASPNALALPGGFIFVMRPLLEFCYWDRDEIAFVIGHEMGHITCRHAIERLMAGSMIQTGLRRVPAVAVLAHVATSLLQQGYSQDQELEADNLGIRLMHGAGFDPAASVRVLTRLGTLPPEAWLGSSYFSSHPPVSVRIERLQRWLSQIS